MKTFKLEIQGSDLVSEQYLSYLVEAVLADPAYGAKVSECKLVGITMQDTTATSLSSGKETSNG